MSILKDIKQQGGTLIAETNPNAYVSPFQRPDFNSVRFNFAVVNPDPLEAFNAYLKGAQLQMQKDLLRTRKNQLQNMNTRAQEAEAERLAMSIATDIKSKDNFGIPNFPKYDNIRNKVYAEQQKIVEEANTAVANRDLETLRKLQSSIPYRFAQIEGFDRAVQEGAALDVFTKMKGANSKVNHVDRKEWLQSSENVYDYLNDRSSEIGAIKKEEEENPVPFDLVGVISNMGNKQISIAGLQNQLKNIEKLYLEPFDYQEVDGTVKVVTKAKPDRKSIEILLDNIMQADVFDDYLYSEYANKGGVEYPLFPTEEQSKAARESFKKTFLDNLEIMYDEGPGKAQKMVGETEEQIKAKNIAQGKEPPDFTGSLFELETEISNAKDILPEDKVKAISEVQNIFKIASAENTPKALSEAIEKALEAISSSRSSYDKLVIHKVSEKIGDSGTYLKGSNARDILGFDTEQLLSSYGEGVDILFLKDKKGITPYIVFSEDMTDSDKFSDISDRRSKPIKHTWALGDKEVLNVEQDNASFINEKYGFNLKEKNSYFGLGDEDIRFLKVDLKKLQKKAMGKDLFFPRGGDNSYLINYRDKVKTLDNQFLDNIYTEDILRENLNFASNIEFSKNGNTVQPPIKQAMLLIDAYAKNAGIESPKITSLLDRPTKVRDKNGNIVDYNNPNSLHYKGYAIDYSYSEGLRTLMESGLQRELESLGFRVIPHGDNSTAFHYHIEWSKKLGKNVVIEEDREYSPFIDGGEANAEQSTPSTSESSGRPKRELDELY